MKPISWSRILVLAHHIRGGTATSPSPAAVFFREASLELAERVLEALPLFGLEDIPTHPDTGRRGQWTRVRSGGRFYPHDPRPEEIFLEDIWWALSFVCRFNGHVDRFYSVLSHSLMVAEMCTLPELCGELSPEERRRLYLAGLLHDATEAYLGDVIRPLKRYLPGYAMLERVVALAIGNRLGLGRLLAELPPSVKIADNLALAVEARELCGDPTDWTIPYAADYPEIVAKYRLVEESPEQARARARAAWEGADAIA